MCWTIAKNGIHSLNNVYYLLFSYIYLSYLRIIYSNEYMLPENLRLGKQAFFFSKWWHDFQVHCVWALNKIKSKYNVFKEVNFFLTQMSIHVILVKVILITIKLCISYSAVFYALYKLYYHCLFISLWFSQNFYVQK